MPAEIFVVQQGGFETELGWRPRLLETNASDGEKCAVRRGCEPKRRSRRWWRAHALLVRHACGRLALLRFGLAPSHILILKKRP